MISLIWGALKSDQRKLFKKQKLSHRHRKQTYGYQRGKGEKDKLGPWDEQIHTITHKQIIIKNLLYSTGNSIQYLVITYNGKRI